MMKKIFLIYAIFVGLSSYSQITLEHDSAYNEYTTESYSINVKNKHSIIDTPRTLKWELIYVDVPETWENDAFICDAVQCWGMSVNSNEYELTDTTDKTLDLHFDNNEKEGEGTARLLIYDVNDSLNTVKTVTYHTKVTLVLPVFEVDVTNFSIYPNPVKDVLYFKNLENVAKIELYNVIGKKIHEITTNNNSEIKLPFNDYNKGIYIIKLINTEGTTILTKNIINN